MIARLLGDERRFWKVSAILFGVLAVVRGCGWPNTWVATQAQVSYQQGFVKRGLYGALFTRPFHLYTLSRFALASYLFLLLALLLLVVLTLRSGLSQRAGNGEAVAVFFSSYCLTYFVHDLGYLEAVLVSCVVGLLLIRSDGRRTLAAFPLCAFALLVHEMFLLVFLPVLLVPYMLRYAEARQRAERTRALLFGLTLLVFCVGVTLLVSAQPMLSASKVAALETDIRTHAGFHVEQNFFIVLRRSLGDNVRFMFLYYRDPVWWLHQAASIFFFGPVVALLLYCTREVLRRAELLEHRHVFTGAAVASLAPLSMHLLGFDAVRWNGLVGVTTFLVLATLCYYTRGGRFQPSPAFRNACVVTMVLSMSAGGSLITGRLLPYPFFDDPGFFRSVRTLLHVQDPQTLTP